MLYPHSWSKGQIEARTQPPTIESMGPWLERSVEDSTCIYIASTDAHDIQKRTAVDTLQEPCLDTNEFNLSTLLQHGLTRTEG